MAFEPIYEIIKSDYKKKITTAQVVAECKLIPEKVMIAKVLSITADSVIDSFETLSGEARYSGKVNFKVMFIDNEGNNHCLDYNAAFSDKISDSAFTPHLKTYVSASVLDTDTVSVNSSEIRLATVVEITVEALISDEVHCLMAAGGDVYTQTEQIVYAKKLSEGNSDWTLSEEIDPKVNIAKILSCDSSALLTGVKPLMDCVLVEGKAVSNIYYETEGGLIKSITHVSQFTQEISANSTRSDMDADAFVRLVKNEVQLVKEEGMDGCIVRINLQLFSNVLVYQQQSIDAVVDAFCISKEMKMVGESFPITRFLFSKTYNDRIEGTATLELEMPEIDNILSVCALRLNITGAVALHNKITIEGIVNTSVLYYNAASNTKNSIAVELPYSLTINQEGAREGQTIMAKGIVCGATAKIRRGNEVELFVDVSYQASYFETTNAFSIKELNFGDDKIQSKSAIAIYITRGGETLWDIAKALMSTPEIILAQNPSIKMPLAANERVLVYKQLSTV